MTKDDTNSETLDFDFPGYETAEALEVMPGSRILGLKPLDIGVAVVRISYSGAKVLVDVHVKEIAGFDPRNFPQMALSAHHRSAHASIYYSVFRRELKVTLKVHPDTQKVVLTFDGDAPIKSHLPRKPISVPYLGGPYPFPDLSGMKTPRKFTQGDVQGYLDKGKWYDQNDTVDFEQSLTAQEEARDLITMLGGDGWLADTQSKLKEHKAANDATEDTDLLFAMGARVSAKDALAFDKGVGFFFGAEYLGLFMMGQASIGVALEISAEFIYAYYWGYDGTPGSALEAFQSINGFASVSIGDGLEVTVDFVFTDSPKFRLCGVNYGFGIGAGASISVGVEKVGAKNYKKPAD